MDENKFRIFFSVLKAMENEDVSKGSIENVIIKIIDNSEKAMTEEQKNRIYNEFVHYERKRKERRESEKRYAHFEEEKYREFLKDFFQRGEFSGWG